MRISDWSSDVCSSDLLVGAVARVAVTPGTRDAEFAILVSRYVAGMGLGRHLMRRLVRWARGKKLERMYWDVLGSTTQTLRMEERRGGKGCGRQSRTQGEWEMSNTKKHHKYDHEYGTTV